ncbi:MAG: hypothetical protein ABII71_05585 [Candidatus Micrarchaeota archaeon]
MISTDVDQMIKIISQKKKLRLNELQGLVDIDRKNVEKWVRVLEDEGYISIEYGMTGTYIVWTGTPHADEELEDLQENDELISEIVEGQAELYRPEEIVAPVEEEPKLTEIPEMESAPEEEAPQEEEQTDEYEDSLEFPSYDDVDVSTEELHEDPIPEDMSHEDEAPLEASGDPELELALDEQEADEKEPESALDDYLSRKRRQAISGNSNLKSNILGNLDDEIESTNQLANDTAVSDDSDGGHPIRDELPEVRDEPMGTVHEIHDMIDEPEGAMQAQVRVKPRSMYSETSSRELINAYLDEINKEKAEIARLSRDKDRLYREKLSGLEARMETDLASLTHHVLERQARIAEIKGHVLSLPDKVDEVDRLQQQMNALGQEGREAIARTSEVVGGYLSTLTASRDAVKAKMDEGRAIIQKEKDKLGELERLTNSAEAKTEKIRASVEATKAQIDELSEGMKSMLSDLEEATEMKVEVAEMAEQLKEQLEEREVDIDSLEADLEEIAKIEHWAMEYLGDYEQKIGELEQYVAKSEDELATVREAAEAAYMKKYLKELESMTDAYNSELSATLRDESDIEEKISGARVRLTRLVKESQAAIRKLHGDDDSPDFETVKSRVKAKTSRVRKTVSEKSGERKRLVEDVGKRRAKKGRKKKK